MIARILMGLPFVVFGLNGFLQFIPLPPAEGPAAAFMGGLAASGFVFPVIKVTEIVAGLMLISGRFVPLALTLLAPIVTTIVLYHAVTVGSGMALPLVLLALGIYLAWSYRDAFKSVLAMNAQPTTAPAGDGALEPQSASSAS